MNREPANGHSAEDGLFAPEPFARPRAATSDFDPAEFSRRIAAAAATHPGTRPTRYSAADEEQRGRGIRDAVEKTDEPSRPVTSSRHQRVEESRRRHPVLEPIRDELVSDYARRMANHLRKS